MDDGEPYDWEDEPDWPERRQRLMFLFVMVGLAGLAGGLALGFILDLLFQGRL